MKRWILILFVAGCCQPDPIVPPNGARGYALAIGLNRVDPAHYGGWDGYLAACETDARTMAGIATEQGYAVDMLLTESATRMTVINRLEAFSELLEPAEILVVSYAGHGGQVRDPSGEEADGLDETWCLYDGQVIDDELAAIWARFADGVRIWIVLDSCYSGGGARDWDDEVRMGALEKRWRDKHPDRSPPPGILRKTYRQNRTFYDAIPREDVSIAASVLLLAASAEDQYSWSDVREGVFTGSLRRTWDEGRWRGNYTEFHAAIAQRVHDMEPQQTPVLLPISGTSFAGERPWTR